MNYNEFLRLCAFWEDWYMRRNGVSVELIYTAESLFHAEKAIDEAAKHMPDYVHTEQLAYITNEDDVIYAAVQVPLFMAHDMKKYFQPNKTAGL